MIEKVLRHNTDMDVQKSYTDRQGQSEVGFAFLSAWFRFIATSKSRYFAKTILIRSRPLQGAETHFSVQVHRPGSNAA